MSQPTNMQKLYKKYTDLQGENLELKEEISELEAEIRDAIAVSEKNKEIHEKVNFLEKLGRKKLEELQVKYDALMEKHIPMKQELQKLKEKRTKRKRKRLKKLQKEEKEAQDAKREGDVKRLKTLR